MYPQRKGLVSHDKKSNDEKPFALFAKLSRTTRSSLPVEQNGCVFNIFVKDYKPAMEAAESYFESKGIACEIVDTTSHIQAINAVLQIMKVFIYGFVSLITLIAVINIINSISNSMNERKTEVLNCLDLIGQY